eukprot:tig00020515_g9778.t1
MPPPAHQLFDTPDNDAVLVQLVDYDSDVDELDGGRVELADDSGVDELDGETLSPYNDLNDLSIEVPGHRSEVFSAGIDTRTLPFDLGLDCASKGDAFSWHDATAEQWLAAMELAATLASPRSPPPAPLSSYDEMPGEQAEQTTRPASPTPGLLAFELRIRTSAEAVVAEGTTPAYRCYCKAETSDKNAGGHGSTKRKEAPVPSMDRLKRQRGG